MNRRERGVALLTVLLLVAAMSALAVGVLDDMRFAIKREANAETIGQARWYALGAETLLRDRLKTGTLDAPRDWNGRALTFSVEGGAIRMRVSDGGQCFNLNSVVEGAAEQWSRRDLGLAQFAVLMREVGLAPMQAESLAEAVADWIDTDSIRNTRGAEDDSYLNAVRPYRTSGTLLSEASELRAIRGFTPEIYARLRPYVCALPSAELSPIDVNLLSADKPELLVMLMAGAIDRQTARRVLIARPATGWPSIDAFWNEEALRGSLPPDAVLAQVTLSPRFFTLETLVDYQGAEAFLTSLLERTATGRVRVAARRWTVDE